MLEKNGKFYSKVSQSDKETLLAIARGEVSYFLYGVEIYKEVKMESLSSEDLLDYIHKNVKPQANLEIQKAPTFEPAKEEKPKLFKAEKKFEKQIAEKVIKTTEKREVLRKQLKSKKHSVCVLCGSRLVGSTLKKYCDRDCFNKREKMTKLGQRTCKVCGVYHIGYKTDKFCSARCAGISHVSHIKSYTAKKPVTEFYSKYLKMYPSLGSLPAGIRRMRNSDYDQNKQELTQFYFTNAPTFQPGF